MSLKKTGKTGKTGTTTKSKGLGDTVAKVTKVTGIAKAVKFLAGEDCGCDKRKDALNKMFPYNQPECLQETEYEFLKSLVPFKRGTYERYEVVRIVEINNRVFHQKLSTKTSCGSCIKTMLDKLIKLFNEYK